MIDFFDEDFPLTKKQEEEEKKRLEAEAERKAAAHSEKTVSAGESGSLEASELAAAQETASADAAQPAQVAKEAISNGVPTDNLAEEDAAVSEAYEPENTGGDMPMGNDLPTEEAATDDNSQPEDEITAGIADDSAEESIIEKAEAAVPEEAVSENDIADVSDIPPAVAAAENVSEDTEAALPEEAVSESDIADVNDTPPAVAAAESVSEDTEAALSEEAVSESVTADSTYTSAEKSVSKRVPTTEELTAEIEEAVNSAINLHIETFIRGIKPAEGNADIALQEKLSRLDKKLDNVEKALGAMEVPLADESDSQDFSYEYDERYFAEEETPAYKYPGLYKRTQADSRDRETASDEHSSRKSAARASSKPRSPGKASGNITVNTKTLLKMGAMVAATAAAVKLLSKKDD